MSIAEDIRKEVDIQTENLTKSGQNMADVTDILLSKFAPPQCPEKDIKHIFAKRVTQHECVAVIDVGRVTYVVSTENKDIIGNFMFCTGAGKSVCRKCIIKNPGLLLPY